MRSRGRRVRRAGAVLAAVGLAVAGCGGEGPEGGPGVRTVAIASPAGAEGAALVELVGAEVRGVTSIDSRVFHHAAGDTVRVVVIRDEPGDLRFALELADTLSLPTATVLEVADGGNGLRDALSGYDVEIRP